MKDVFFQDLMLFYTPLPENKEIAERAQKQAVKERLTILASQEHIVFYMFLDVIQRKSHSVAHELSVFVA